MTRRRLLPEERARRFDVHLYPKHEKIIDFALQKFGFLNPSAVVREALECFAHSKLGDSHEVDRFVQMEEELKSFQERHDGKAPHQVKAELDSARLAQVQAAQDASLGLEKKVYGFLVRRSLEDYRTLDWFKSAWYENLKAKGWRGSPEEVMRDLLAKGRSAGW